MSEYIIKYKYYNYKDFIENFYNKNTNYEFIQKINNFDNDILINKDFKFQSNFIIDNDDI